MKVDRSYRKQQKFGQSWSPWHLKTELWGYRLLLSLPAFIDWRNLYCLFFFHCVVDKYRFPGDRKEALLSFERGIIKSKFLRPPRSLPTPLPTLSSSPIFCLAWVFYRPRTPGNSTCREDVLPSKFILSVCLRERLETFKRVNTAYWGKVDL